MLICYVCRDVIESDSNVMKSDLNGYFGQNIGKVNSDKTNMAPKVVKLIVNYANMSSVRGCGRKWLYCGGK